MVENNSQQDANEHIELLRDHIDDQAIDTQSDTSSASELQLPKLENRLEIEMAKMATMVKNTVTSLQNSVSSLTEQFERKFLQIEQKLNNITSNKELENQNANRSASLFNQTHQSNSHTDSGGDPFTLGRISQCRGDNMPQLSAPSNQSCFFF